MITEIGANPEVLFFEFDSEDNATDFAKQEKLSCGAMKWGVIQPKLEGRRVYFDLCAERFTRISVRLVNKQGDKK